MSVISEKFNSKIHTLKKSFKENRSIAHQGTKGGLNESELSSLIKEVIPTKYKVAKGIIENPSGNQSNETDIFIYDDEIIPPYIKNDLTFVPVESVRYVFEVKSTLDAGEIKTTIQKFQNFKSIGGGLRPPFYFHFLATSKEASFCVTRKAIYLFLPTQQYLSFASPANATTTKKPQSTTLRITCPSENS